MKFSASFISAGAFLGLYVSGVRSTATIDSLFRRSAATIEQELTFVKGNLTAYDTTLHTFFAQGGSLVQGVALHQLAGVSLSALNTTILDIEATGPLSESDAATIEASVASIEPILVDICQTLVSEVASGGFSSLPLGGIPVLIKSDFIAMRSAFNELLSLLGTATPADVSPEFASLETQFGNGCDIGVLLPA